MDTARLRQVEEVFERVHALPRERWGSALEEACKGDAELRAEVERFLRVVGTTHQGPLDRPPTEAAGIAAQARLAPAAIAVGATVGRYEILSVLGEGGMGVVYRARQSRPSREVALKVIRPGLAGPALLRRFEFEAEMLGRLKHPGIAQIIEAGTFDTGLGPQPYFAMELVEGRALLEHANAAALAQRERLELMRRVCEAVEHAHQRGVIHRDLKPGNILVDAAGQPKILDFGVARAVDSGSGANPQITLVATGDRPLIGTLAYMSPEQVEADPARIDTRTDVYALGVILYQLVSGRLPHDLSGKALADALRTVTEADPPSLSTVLSSARGDLETIAAKALEKDRDRRYQSAAALADDLRRFLSDEPIAARPPSAWYQVRKFTRRNRALVVGASVAVAALVVGLGATAA
ncbi:MAG: serine/threonine protein kinase, partial [Planctomycetes bacterium]|nr:serine/threonine protein kinase [Planctomycetota bacterium]